MQTVEYKEGYNAYLEGEGKETNPYHSSKEQADSDKYDDWLQGWFDAMDDEDELEGVCPECGEDSGTMCGAVNCKY